MSQTKRIVGFLFFTTLMLAKVSAFHVHTHDRDDCDHEEECELCDWALEFQTAELEIPSPIIPKVSESTLFIKPFTEKVPVFSSVIKVHQLFSRPPPLHR